MTGSEEVPREEIRRIRNGGDSHTVHTGMREADTAGPERRRVSFYFSAVPSVTCQRESTGSKLNADLVGAAGVEGYTD